MPAAAASMPTACISSTMIAATVEAATVEAAAMETTAAAVEAADMAAAASNMHASGRSRFICCEKRSHQGQRGQTRYGRSRYGVSHRGELQSFRVQRRKAEKVPRIGAVRAAPGDPRPLREAPFGVREIACRSSNQAHRPDDGEITRCDVRRCERNHMATERCACWSSAAETVFAQAKSAWWSGADKVSLEYGSFSPIEQQSDPTFEFASTRLGRCPCSQKNRCLERLTLANAMSIMNRTLRNSEGTSIIVWRLDRTKAEHQECYRRNSAARAVNSENIQGLRLHALQPSGLRVLTPESLYNLRLRGVHYTSQGPFL